MWGQEPGVRPDPRSQSALRRIKRWIGLAKAGGEPALIRFADPRLGEDGNPAVANGRYKFVYNGLSFIRRQMKRRRAGKSVLHRRGAALGAHAQDQSAIAADLWLGHDIVE